MSQRGPRKHGAGTYALPGGHREHLAKEGRLETIAEAAAREAGEELGDRIAIEVRTAFALGRVAVLAHIDDLRQEGVYYERTAVIIQLPYGIEPDSKAPEAWEHTDLRWRSTEEAAQLLQQEKIYPSHVPQVASFLAHEARYVQLPGYDG